MKFTMCAALLFYLLVVTKGAQDEAKADSPRASMAEKGVNFSSFLDSLTVVVQGAGKTIPQPPCYGYDAINRTPQEKLTKEYNVDGLYSRCEINSDDDIPHIIPTRTWTSRFCTAKPEPHYYVRQVYKELTSTKSSADYKSYYYKHEDFDNNGFLMIYLTEEGAYYNDDLLKSCAHFNYSSDKDRQQYAWKGGWIIYNSKAWPYTGYAGKFSRPSENALCYTETDSMFPDSETKWRNCRMKLYENEVRSLPTICKHCEGTGNSEKDPTANHPCTDYDIICKPCKGKGIEIKMTEVGVKQYLIYKSLQAADEKSQIKYQYHSRKNTNRHIAAIELTTK